MDSDSSLKSLNTIAYDKTLREYMSDLHSVLDIGVTDISAQAITLSIKYKADAVKQLKFMSKLTADLSVSLIKAKGDKELNAEEQKQFDIIKELADTLGNLQFKINRLIMDMAKMESLGEQISKEGEALLDSIMIAQNSLIHIRGNISDLGFLSQNHKIAVLFSEQNE